MKPGRILILLALLLIAVVIYVNKCSSGNSRQKNVAGNSKSGAPLQVSGIIVSPQTVSDQIYASGTLMAIMKLKSGMKLADVLHILGFRKAPL